MKTVVSLVFVIALLVNVVHGQDERKAGDVPLKTTKDQASYAIGMNIGDQIKASPDLNPLAVLQGIRDILGDAAPRLTEAQRRAALAAYQQMMQTQAAQRGEQNKRAGQAFLNANKKKEEVQTLPSGLQYTVLKSGNGPSPKISQTVKTHYHGTLIDGTVFDSSVQRNEPFSFQVGGRVIRGWNEAVQLMKVGDKWRLFVPPELAYGPDGSPPVIGPHSTLIFEVELLEIQ